MIKEIKTILYVGAGTMGVFNALNAALSGYEALLYDLSEEAMISALPRLRELGSAYISLGIIDQAILDSGISRLKLVSDPEEAASITDLFSESVPERMELK